MDPNRIGRRKTGKKVVREKEMIAISIALPFLPDEILVNILSRLSVKMVIRCRLVCKRWSIITSFQDFVDLNFRHSLPLIVVTDSLLHLWGKWWEPPRLIHKFPFDLKLSYLDNFDSLVSQGGLFVYYDLKPSQVVSCIFNPIYPRVNVKITLSDLLRTSKIYGVFFHPSLNEYCSLWKIKASDEPCRLPPDRIYYMMLTLGSNPSLKTVTVSNELLERDKRPGTQFLLIGNHLYWMLMCQPDRLNGRNDVMKFDITTEEFSVLHCPIPLDTECSYNHTHLLDIDGILSYLLVLPGKITIWRLKDDNEQLWTANEYILNAEICICGLNRALAVVNGKFAFLLDSKLFVCNLMEGTVKYCQKKKYSSYLDLSHQMSLASLSNCKPTISIDQDQDNKVVLVEE